MLTQFLVWVFWISVISGSLVEIKFDEGEIRRNAEPGSQVLFDAPLRANRQNPSQIMISVANEIASDTFGVFPTVLSPGDPFALILRDSDSIPVMEKDNIFEVPFSVSQLSNPNETETFSLFVKLLDSRPEIPRIWKSEQNFKLSQRLTNGIVGKIGIKNLDKTDLELFSYQLFGGFSELFTIEKAKEGLFLRTSGCAPEVCIKLPDSFSLLLRITPLEPLSMLNETEIALLHFQISRENMLGPRFSQHEYDATIYEKSPYFLETVQLEAADSDYLSNSEEQKTVFSLSKPSAIFQIDPFTGVLSVKNESLITIDTIGSEMKMMAEVTDGKNPSDITEITIKILEEKIEETHQKIEGYEFEEQIYAFAVSPKQTKVGKVSLMNNQKGVIKIVEGGAGNFGIEEGTGELTYHGPLERFAKNYTLKILATPTPHSPTIALTVAQILVAGIGSHLPLFTEPFETLIVNYTTNPETKIHQLEAKDSDMNAAMVFALESASNIDFLSNPIPFGDEFAVYPNGEIIVKDLPSTLSSTTLNVSVQDKSHKLETKDYAQIVIIVRHDKHKIEIEKLFKFEKLENPIIIADDLPTGTYVHTVLLNPLSFENAEMLKPNISYSISIASNSRYYTIAKETGMIYTASSLKHIGLQNLTVLAEVSTTKGIHKLETLIPIDAVSMEGETPKLEIAEKEMKLSIEENSAVETEIGKINILKNEGEELFYEIIGGNDMVEVDDRGRILVKKNIDYEIMKEIPVFVNISNSLEKFVVLPIVIKVINVNDEKPKFTNTQFHQFSTFENAPLETYLGSMTASDADGDRLVYSLTFPESSPISNKVSINPRGDLSISGPLRKLEGIFKFIVSAKDDVNSVSQECELTIVATSRCQPIFDKNQEIVFNVKETLKPGTSFGMLKAASEDADECDPLSYQLQFLNNDSDSIKIFKLDSDSGVLSTYSSLQSFSRFRFPIIIAAGSGSFFTRKAAEIRVISTKSDAPNFPQKHLRIELPENNPANISLGSFKTLGKQIHYKLEDTFDGTFSIDSDDGTIYVEKSLDREVRSLYRLNVMASSDPNFIDGLTDTAVVNVVVNDINDNGPSFERDSYEIVLDSETLPGKEVFSLQAKDKDSASKLITYKIEKVLYKNSNFNGVFEIKHDSGKIRLLKNVTDFAGGIFEISVSATEQEEEISHLAHSTLFVWIADRDAHSIPILIHQNPIELSTDQLRQYSSKLGQAINNGSTILLLSLRFHYISSEAASEAESEAVPIPMVVRDSTLAEFVAVNRKLSKIYAWDSVKASIRDLDIDKISLLSGTSIPSSSIHSHMLMSSEASLTLLAVIFFILLVCIMAVLGIILCYYRKKFKIQKKNLVEAKIAAATMNRGAAPIRHWSPYLERPPELLWERSTTATTGSTTPERRSSHSVQEMKITVT